MKSKMPFDVFIFLSSEDDKHLVSGGIGTYLGLMTKYCKKLWPNAEVFWLTKSHTKKDFFEEIDGVKRYYFSDQVFFKNKPFYTNIIHHKFEDMVVYENFISKLSNKVSDILREYSGKNIYIESGEWEGHGKDIFNIINSPNILKNVRLHTPLASCIKQNGLIVSSSTALQLVNEFQTIINADCISACTDFVKSTLVKDVLGKKLANTLNSKIIVRPNPIDKKNFSHSNITRNQAIDFLNSIVGRSFFDETTFNILLIGSVEYRKGTHLMIKS
ncbi:MAG: hypothetical protein Q8Q23_03950, partial [bacterium]|nr:hypothetical protein [bacterium]